MEHTPPVPSPSLFDLAGRNVLITGASRGQSRSSLPYSLQIDLLTRSYLFPFISCMDCTVNLN